MHGGGTRLQSDWRFLFKISDKKAGLTFLESERILSCCQTEKKMARIYIKANIEYTSKKDATKTEK